MADPGDIVDRFLGGGRFKWKYLHTDAIEQAVAAYRKENPTEELPRLQLIQKLQVSIRNKRFYAKKHGTGECNMVDFEAPTGGGGPVQVKEAAAVAEPALYNVVNVHTVSSSNTPCIGMVVARDPPHSLCQVLLAQPQRQTVILARFDELERILDEPDAVTDRGGSPVAVHDTVMIRADLNQMETGRVIGMHGPCLFVKSDSYEFQGGVFRVASEEVELVQKRKAVRKLHADTAQHADGAGQRGQAGSLDQEDGRPRKRIRLQVEQGQAQSSANAKDADAVARKQLEEEDSDHFVDMRLGKETRRRRQRAVVEDSPGCGLQTQDEGEFGKGRETGVATGEEDSRNAAHLDGFGVGHAFRGGQELMESLQPARHDSGDERGLDDAPSALARSQRSTGLRRTVVGSSRDADSEHVAAAPQVLAEAPAGRSAQSDAPSIQSGFRVREGAAGVPTGAGPVEPDLWVGEEGQRPVSHRQAQEKMPGEARFKLLQTHWDRAPSSQPPQPGVLHSPLPTLANVSANTQSSSRIPANTEPAPPEPPPIDPEFPAIDVSAIPENRFIQPGTMRILVPRPSAKAAKVHALLDCLHYESGDALEEDGAAGAESCSVERGGAGGDRTDLGGQLPGKAVDTHARNLLQNGVECPALAGSTGFAVPTPESELSWQQSAKGSCPAAGSTNPATNVRSSKTAPLSCKPSSTTAAFQDAHDNAVAVQAGRPGFNASFPEAGSSRKDQSASLTIAAPAKARNSSEDGSLTPKAASAKVPALLNRKITSRKPLGNLVTPAKSSSAIASPLKRGFCPPRAAGAGIEASVRRQPPQASPLPKLPLPSRSRSGYQAPAFQRPSPVEKSSPSLFRQGAPRNLEAGDIVNMLKRGKIVATAEIMDDTGTSQRELVGGNVDALKFVTIRLTEVEAGFEDEEAEVEIDRFETLEILRRSGCVFTWRRSEVELV